jgi:hypothetical protein
MMGVFSDGETMKVSGSGFAVDRYTHAQAHAHAQRYTSYECRHLTLTSTLICTPNMHDT